MKSIQSMKIGINGVALLSPLTGIGQYTYHLTKELQQILDIQPWLFYGAGWRQEVRHSPLPGVGGLKKLIKHFVPNSYRVSRFLQNRQFGLGMKKCEIELYHEPNFIAYPCARPTVVTVHDLSWIRHPETHPAERVKMMDSLMPDVVRNAQHLLVDSDFVRGEVIGHYGVSPDKVTTVLLGVSPLFKPADAETCRSTLERHGLRYGEYLLAVGTLEPRKNLATVIAAFQQLPASLRIRYPLVIVGMNGWHMEKFSSTLQQMIASGEVKLAGYATQQDLPLLYAGARLFVYPSIYEGFGLPPLEAMACGVPVIVSRRASLPEVVGDAGIMVEALDSQAIAGHMREVLEDPALYRRLSVAGRERSEQFSWRKCALETAAVYRQVLDES